MHLDEGYVLDATTATGRLATELTARAAELTVQRVRAFGDPHTWVRIQEMEGTEPHLVLDLTSVQALVRSLSRIVTNDPPHVG